MTREQDDSGWARTGRAWIESLGFDARALAAFRIGLALVVLATAITAVRDLGTFYTDESAVPRALALEEREPPLQFRWLFLSGTPIGVGLLLLPLFVAAVSLALGRWTRVSTLICWLGVCALMARNPYGVDFGDRILRVLLFWSLFLPLAEAWVPGRAKRGGQIFGLAVVAYLVQLVLIYFMGALHKSDVAWWEGNAVSLALTLDQMTTPIGAALREWPTLLQLATFGTLVLEGVWIWLVISPWRTGACRVLAAAAFIAFHLALSASLRLGVFPLVCVVAWLPLIPGPVFDRLGLGPKATGARSTALPGAVAAAVVTLLALTVATNLYGLFTPTSQTLPSPLDRSSRGFGLEQRWSLFAPRPDVVDGWLVATGHRRDGTLVDALRGGPAAGATRPDDPGAGLSARWIGYVRKLYAGRERPAQKQALARYLCLRWNASHPADEAIDFVAIDFFQELTLPDGREDAPIRVPLTRHACEDEHRAAG